MSKKRKPDRPTVASVPPPPPVGQRSGARTSPHWAWVLAAFAALALLAAVAWQLARAPTPPPATPSIARPVVASFAGSLACKSCHEQQFAAWTSSQHARTMQHATAETVRGDFNDAKLTYQGVTSNFFERDGKFFVRTDGPDGKLADFEVKYTFGVEPLQQYLVDLPGGRLQALAVAWDTRPKDAGRPALVSLYPDEKIDFRDELHWTRRAQNWNFMCADCHSTNLQRLRRGPRTLSQRTWNEISVGCESCHGPGSAHLAWADSKAVGSARKGLTVQLDERRGVSWTSTRRPAMRRAAASAPASASSRSARSAMRGARRSPRATAPGSASSTTTCRRC